MVNKGPIGARLLVRIELDKEGNFYDTYEQYTDLNEKTILALGYLPAKGYKEEFRYFNTKVYVKMEGFKVFDIRNSDDPNYETSSTLDDYFQSDSQKQFMQSMSKVSFAPLDMKKLGMIGMVGAGIILGLFVLGGM